jgi:integrase
MLKEKNVRTGFFEVEVFQAVVKQLPVSLQPVATFAYITGWRKEEVLALTWRQVDFKAEVVRLEPGTTKNGEGRTVFMTAELKELLEDQCGLRQWPLNVKPGRLSLGYFIASESRSGALTWHGKGPGSEQGNLAACSTTSEERQ